MTEHDLEVLVATFLCQMHRITRDMPRPEEVERALPYARGVIGLVRSFKPDVDAGK